MLGDASRNLLLQLSNTDLELKAAKEFMKNAIEKLPAEAELFGKLFENTANGNKLTEKMFGCRVSEIPEKVRNGTLSPSNTPESKADRKDEIEPAKEDSTSCLSFRSP
jgi:hypothetical protein